MDRWFFATDTDPPWHIHSLPVAVWFDQGALGALAWVLVVAVAGVTGLRLWRQRRAALPVALAAVAAFLVSGALNTLIDEPRFLGLLLICLWLCTLPSSSSGPVQAARAPVPDALPPAPAAAP
jgi:O-antigen ligase